MADKLRLARGQNLMGKTRPEGPIGMGERLRRLAGRAPSKPQKEKQDGGATGKHSKVDVQRGVGRGCILMLWSSLWLTFGHAIYFISILFYIASKSKYARQYFPEVGEEWFPSEMIKKIPKTTLIPIKLAETVGIVVILLWTLMLDVACIGILALLLGIISSIV